MKSLLGWLLTFIAAAGLTTAAYYFYDPVEIPDFSAEEVADVAFPDHKDFQHAIGDGKCTQEDCDTWVSFASSKPPKPRSPEQLEPCEPVEKTEALAYFKATMPKTPSAKPHAEALTKEEGITCRFDDGGEESSMGKEGHTRNRWFLAREDLGYYFYRIWDKD